MAGNASARDTDWEGVRLHIVTGKGGTGKTTVAAALALALADQGQRVLLAEVEGRQGISQTFDVAPLAATEARIAHAENGGEVFGLAV
ncbi:MAG: ArsA-related P-loop ATPase, partial [Oryzihumus sp.]